MKKFVPALVFVFAAILVLQTGALGCSCIKVENPTLEESVKAALKSSAAVFSGEVIERIPNQSNTGYTAKLKIDEWWKGGDMTEISLKIGNDSCAYDLEKGAKYLLFAYDYKSELKIGLCGQNRRFDQLTGELEILGKGTKPKKPDTK